MIPTLIVIAIFVLLTIVLRRPNRNSFDTRFPPISDAEFLQRCAPGTNPEIALRVRRIIAEQLGIPTNQIYPEHRFVEDLHAD